MANHAVNDPGPAGAETMKTRFDTLILGALLLTFPRVLAGQDVKPKPASEVVSTTPPASSSVDPRFRSPRATVRTFLIAMNASEEDPHRIEDAVACLDLSELPPTGADGGRFAFELEYILRSTNIPTFVITDVAEGTECEIGEGKDIRLRLHRRPDGRWLFEGKTLQNLPKLRLLLWEKSRRGQPGQRYRRRSRRVPIAVRDVSHVHCRAEERRSRCGSAVPGPDRDPRSGPPSRRQGPGLQAQGSPRSQCLRDLPGHSRHVGGRPAGGRGPQGRPDHRRAAGHG